MIMSLEALIPREIAAKRRAPKAHFTGVEKNIVTILLNFLQKSASICA